MPIGVAGPSSMEQELNLFAMAFAAGTGSCMEGGRGGSLGGVALGGPHLERSAMQSRCIARPHLSHLLVGVIIMLSVRTRTSCTPNYLFTYVCMYAEPVSLEEESLEQLVAVVAAYGPLECVHGDVVAGLRSLRWVHAL